MTSIQISGYGQAGFRRRGANEVKNLLIGVERFATPVFRDFGEEAMLDRIPLGSTGGIVSDGDIEVERIGELGLEFGFPCAAPAAVAASSIGQDEQLARVSVLKGAFTQPPVSDGVSGECGSIVRDAYDNGTAIQERLIDAVGNGNADGVRAKVVIEDRPGVSIPAGA